MDFQLGLGRGDAYPAGEALAGDPAPAAVDVSVVIPVFNDSANLAGCLRSVSAQCTTVTFEVLVLDDCSTDESRETALALGARVISHEQRQGQARLRNEGASMARGRWLLFLDADVRIGPEIIERCVQYMAGGKEARICGLQGMFLLRTDLRRWPSLIYNSFQHLLTRSPEYGPAVNSAALFIERSVFDELGGFNSDVWFMEDDEFGLRLERQGYTLRRAYFSFAHGKEISWRWLLLGHLLGGQSLCYLHRRRARNPLKTGAPPPVVSTSGGRNSFFRDSLLALVVLVATPLACGISFWLGMVLATIGLAITFRFVRVYWAVRPDPRFVVAASAAALVASAAIVAGMISNWRGRRPSAAWRIGWLSSGGRGVDSLQATSE